MENAENKTMAPAVKYAKEYMKTAKLPLTEVDLAHSFTQGKNFGRSAAWQRVDESTPVSMTIEELKKENAALKEENARLTYSVAELLKKIEEYKAAWTSRNRMI